MGKVASFISKVAGFVAKAFTFVARVANIVSKVAEIVSKVAKFLELNLKIDKKPVLFPKGVVKYAQFLNDQEFLPQ